MASDSEDSDGESLPLERCDHLQELHSVLDLYPDDGQILKELIQNAEDAGATEVKVLADKRTFHQDWDLDTLERHPHLRFLQGPALCVYNNAKFTTEDWKGIRMLRTSIKKEDPLKVGRFGLGFKSVFHLTDRLVILSGDYIMYMDPFKKEGDYCKRHRVAGRKKTELESVMTSLEGTFGVSRETFQKETGHFPGTLFWFPLRQQASDLSSTVYDEQKVEQLLTSFRAEASSLLLFLNHILRVTVMIRDDRTPCPKEVFSVEVASSCLEGVRSERQRFIGEIKSAAGGLPENEVACLTDIAVETKDSLTSSTESQRWLVVSYHSGQNQISEELSKLCSDHKLCYRPYVGVAIPLSNQHGFQSQIFCFLPLPLDTRSPTGLPVHVHGCFAVEQNRRHLKWPPADQQTRDAKPDPASQWNCLLVKELLPRAYKLAIERLKDQNIIDPEKFYTTWPDERHVQDRWKPLLEPLLESLVQMPVFFSPIQSGCWVLIKEAVLHRFNQDFSQDVQAAVVKVYTLSGQKLVKLPEHIHYNLKKLGLLKGVEKIKPSRVSQLISQGLSRLDRSEKLCLLHYLCQLDEHFLLDQPLLPLANGEFGTFKSRPSKKSKKSKKISLTYWCPEDIVRLFPGLEENFCDFSVPDCITKDLARLAKKERTTVDRLHNQDPKISGILQKSLEVRFKTGKPTVDSSDDWIQRVWQYLRTVDDLAPFSGLPLLPMKKDLQSSPAEVLWELQPLKGIYLCRDAKGYTSLSPALGSALSKLGITVMEDIPDYVRRHTKVLGNFIHFPSNTGILKAVEKVNADHSLTKEAIRLFNASSTEDEKAALVHFVVSSSGGALQIFRYLELFTDALTKGPASIEQVPCVGPEELPPVPASTKFLLCDPSERKAAICLGAKQMTVTDIVRDIMEKLSSEGHQYSEDQVIQFMTYFLRNKQLLEEPSLQEMAKKIRFVRTESNEVKTAGDLYDPTIPLLKELFHSQHSTVFPSGDFAQPDMLRKLRKLGLKKEKDVKETDIVNTAKIISEMFCTNQQETAQSIAQGLFAFLKEQAVPRSALQAIATMQCMPCAGKPKDYPKSLHLKSNLALVKPAEMSIHTLLYVTGSVVPALPEGFSEDVAKHLQVKTEAEPDHVLQHLKNILANFQQEEASQYKLVLKQVFQFLADQKLRTWAVSGLQEENCVLVETGEKFAKPGSFWIDSKPDDIDLKPYRFALPMEIALPLEMESVRDLMKACGSSASQSVSMLHDVLSEIQSKHAGCECSHPDFHPDFQLVKQILDVLKRNPTACDGNTLLPVVNPHHTEVLSFQAAKHCTIHPGSSDVYDSVPADTGFEIFHVHSDISNSTALSLGALQMKDRALTDIEELDYSFGQHEDLTDRLSKLLKEAYTDGFSMPKELIQNADDAGATKVCFLLDERENMAFRTNLIDEKMDSLQGPAIWAYNDAEFSDTDFENIVKLGAGTKKDDTTKVGRFGLGFNAVYNLTDVPSFISGNKLAMFDPQVKYIRKGKGGLQLDFTKPANKALLGRMPEQFGPYQDVFGCSLRHNKDTFFKGTLFRFPLRTAEQASSSKLKRDSYSETKRHEFLRLLLEKAGSLLMFTQCVMEIEVYFLSNHTSDPKGKQCLLSVKKSGAPTPVQPSLPMMDSKTVLQFMKEQWSDENKNIQMQQKIRIELAVTKEAKDVCGIEETQSVTHWQLAWASGISQSAKMVQFYEQEGLVPLAAVAVSLHEDQIVAVKDSPDGFYNTGHLFCFLPLPEEMVRFSLPVHINGTFALTSDRRGLLVQTEDDLEMEEASWNQVLFDDAVVRAYLLLLELVKPPAASDTEYSQYFKIWPTDSMGCLVESFYQHLQSDQNKVFPVPDSGEWVSFSDARFLDPDFRKSACGKSAWQCLQKYWKGPGHLVDVPDFICSLIREKGPHGSFEEQVITELAFFRDFFFPHVQETWWDPDSRDRLVHHALMRNDKHINQLIKDTPCIPCEFASQLRKPNELIHPRDKVAKLFLASEGYFPQKGTTEAKEKHGQKSSQVNFCDYQTLIQLSSLGMITNKLSWEMVLERAESVSQLNADTDTENASLDRASNLVEYLSSMTKSDNTFENCPPTVLASLSKTAFLPVLLKPEDWPFPWAEDASSCSRRLAPPKDLYSDSLKDLVSCHEELLDTKALKRHTGFLTTNEKEVLKALGMTVDRDFKHGSLRELAVQQLKAVVKHCKADSSIKRAQVQFVITEIYMFLMHCLKYAEDGDSVRGSIQSELCEEEVIWTGTDFVHPSYVAFICPYDCSPYLFQMEKSLLPYKPFFETIGVKEKFETNDLLSVLVKVYENNAKNALTDDMINLVSRLAQLLTEIVKNFPETESLDMTQVYLPDSDAFMRPASHMCVNDCDWLEMSDRMKLVNPMIAPEVAQVLGVKSKRGQDLDTQSERFEIESFGQHEKLTSRIQRLLQGYTFDTSLWKELIQNADDAGATEARLIMDFRQLGKTTVPENWEELQGPALCFYNNRSFTREDMQGIQNLGLGSKQEDLMKIGQYGVGFSAVFHITDVPSFWTKEDDKKDVICVLDPNCQYVPNVKRDKPGIKFTNIDRLRQQYPDFMSGYLGSAIDMSQSGTLFRFPLRTSEMAAVSEIKEETVAEQEIKELLESFKNDMATCLLFLNSLQTIGIYSVKEDGSLELQFDVSRTVHDTSQPQAAQFRSHLQQASERLKQKSTSIKDIDVCKAVVQFELSDSSGRKEQWLTVHQLGLSEDKDLPPALLNDFRSLPQGGVAIKLGDTESSIQQKPQRTTKHQAFCTLPLPVDTHLPVHINGHFALDHETRRDLWDGGNSKGDAKSEWNETIAIRVVVPAYITALQHVKTIFFPAEEKDPDIALRNIRLQQYHDLFPNTNERRSEIWNNLTMEIYRGLAKQELPLFPVSHPEKPELEWVPAVRKDGFPGYFNNLNEHFMDQLQERAPAKPVVLSQGGPRSDSKTSHESKAKNESTVLALVLKRSNMKILEAPFRIYHDFKASGVEEVQQVTPNSVLTFLKSSRQRRLDGCSIHDLPKNVCDTPLQTVDNVRKLVDFLRKDQIFLDSLDGLPLSFRQSGTLQWFSNTDRIPKPIISQFSHLLPGSADEFLHENIRHFFHVTEKTKSSLRQLDILMFASMLPQTLSDPGLKSGKPCMFETKFPCLPHNKAWLQDLWTFFKQQLECKNAPCMQKDSISEQEKCELSKHSEETQPPVKVEADHWTEKEKAEGKDIQEIRQKATKMFHILHDWCFIPVRKKKEKQTGEQEEQEILMLYPLLDLQKVVYLPESQDQSNAALWTILKRLPLPVLDQLGPSSIANELVASITHPRALLHALVSCKDCLPDSLDDGKAILQYFCNNLAVLEETSTNKTELLKELRNLPMFPAVDKKLVSVKQSVPVICLQSSVPSAGLSQWSQQRNHPLTLLCADSVPSKLSKYLGFEDVTDAQFYAQYLLPSISSLPHSDIVTHMGFLSKTFFSVYSLEDTTEEEKHLCRQLKDTAFIEVDGELKKACDFFTPVEPVFAAMCPERFPPEPYNSGNWINFTTAAGMITDITDDMFLSFAREVERQGSAGITKDVTKKSETLVKHLFTRKNLIRSRLLMHVRSIRFLLPLDWTSVTHAKQLEKMAPPYSTGQLVSFAESSSSTNLHLLWSSSCLIDSWVHPQRRFSGKMLNQVMSQLSLQDKAPEDKVIQHVRNICDRLGGQEGSDVFASFTNKQLLISVMEAIYRYMMNHSLFFSPVRDWKVICDIDNSQMLYPANVVIDLRQNESIKGHIEKAPHHFGRYFDLFKKLGAAQNVTANHYARVLSWLKGQSKNDPLNVEELKTAKTASEGVFRCRKGEAEEQRQIIVDVLYLPTEEKCLQDATRLIFKDDYLGERLQTPPDGMYFFLGFDKLGIAVGSPQDEVKRLPKQYRLVLMSDIVHEIIPDEILKTAKEADSSNPMVWKLLNPKLKQAIVRLANYWYKQRDEAFTKEAAEKVVQTLENVTVKEVPELKTVVTMHNRTVSGSEQSKDSFMVKKEGDPKMADVFVSAKAIENWPRQVEEICIHSLATAVQFVVLVELDSYLLHYVLQHPEQAEGFLNVSRIPQCIFASVLNDAVFPEPGECVPLHFHRHLNNGFSEFYSGEHVGYKTYGSQIDCKDEDTDPDTDPVFKYGIIVKEVDNQNAKAVGRLTSCYLVDLGPDYGKVEVNVVKLYKFVR